MQQKSSRGVQQHEVDAAADALLAERLRPTVERVRLKIGRGSPNSVGPMLESWFAGLALRLGVAPESEQGDPGRPPLAAREAFDALWATALSMARAQADALLTAQRDELAGGRAALEAARQELAVKDLALVERAAALEHALELAKAQLRDGASHLEQMGRDLASARDSLATLIQERDAERRRFERQLAAAAEGRERIEQRTAATERRLLEEVDRARQEAKLAARGLEETSQRHAAERRALEDQREGLREKINQANLEVATLRERLHAADLRATQLQAGLDTDRTPSARKRAKAKSAGVRERALVLRPASGR